MDTIRQEGCFRSDKRVYPSRHVFESVPYTDLRERRHSHLYMRDDAGRYAKVKVTGVDTWKTRPEIVVRWKYGLYEYGGEEVNPEDIDTGFYLRV